MNYEIPGHLEVKKGHLHIGGVDTVQLAQQYGTPLYVTNEDRLRDNYRRFAKAFKGVPLFFAAKSNNSLVVQRILAQEGAGADAFSDGEIYLARLAGIPAQKILFTGNSKTDAELAYAVEAGVMVSIDSHDELISLSHIAKAHGKTMNVAFRVNPEISGDTHPKLATGLKISKFGIPRQEIVDTYKEASKLPGINPVGIHCHIGSQILEVSPYVETVNRMMDLVAQISKFVDLEFVDIGGGFGIPYQKDVKAPTPQDYAKAILPLYRKRCKEIGISPELHIEPGRYIVADTTVLLTHVNTVKKAYSTFIGVDAGFNTLIRPAMYDSYHEVVVANKADKKSASTYTVAGPICESGDILARDRKLPQVKKDDIIALLDAGAYGFCMSSQYLARPRSAEVLIHDGQAELIRKRETYDDLIQNQLIPGRLL
ncbi:diaminopimelate decarboxylase [Methanocella paludicola SANAE]|uniref:Diaminopimelate decarboxylase n=1 Tax=Methanocella paludicola (strain DSM 17711 / JCM 13418 / NBRC 101707 / SANAE) TaxID=304371 RepID=D1YWV9_METPS|nr:diaminopimelate decarboxylase [Methanocella paludicola]BAI60931.1 diaminopimelate decarboxylase [Methanocella paludicola SANAE]